MGHKTKVSMNLPWQETYRSRRLRLPDRPRVGVSASHIARIPSVLVSTRIGSIACVRVGRSRRRGICRVWIRWGCVRRVWISSVRTRIVGVRGVRWRAGVQRRVSDRVGHEDRKSSKRNK